jgi:hypothetical protein
MAAVPQAVEHRHRPTVEAGGAAAEGWSDRIAEPGWLDQAREAVARLPRCKFFSDPVTLPQFVGPKFVPLCLGGAVRLRQGQEGRAGA